MLMRTGRHMKHFALEGQNCFLPLCQKTCSSRDLCLQRVTLTHWESLGELPALYSSFHFLSLKVMMSFLTPLQTARYIFQFSECLARLPFQQELELLNSTKLDSEAIETSNLVKRRNICSCWALSCKPSTQKQDVCYLSWKILREPCVWPKEKIHHKSCLRGNLRRQWKCGSSLSGYIIRFNFW